MALDVYGLLSIALVLAGPALILFSRRAAWRLLGAGLLVIGLVMLYLLAQGIGGIFI